jgi:hypothetical protein
MGLRESLENSNMGESAAVHRRRCAIGFGASLIASGVLSAASTYWHPLALVLGVHRSFRHGVGCAANWPRNRSFHCAITGPLFLMAGIFFLLADLRSVLAFLLEWRYAKRSVG